MATERPLSEEKLNRVRIRIRKLLERNRSVKNLKEPDPPPLYDEVYFRGLEELEKGGTYNGS